MAQSSVEWLYEKLDGMIPKSALYNGDKIRYLEQAKAMHKEEIETAYQSERYPCSDEDAQDYYNQIFGK